MEKYCVFAPDMRVSGSSEGERRLGKEIGEATTDNKSAAEEEVEKEIQRRMIRSLVEDRDRNYGRIRDHRGRRRKGNTASNDKIFGRG